MGLTKIWIHLNRLMHQFDAGLDVRTVLAPRKRNASLEQTLSTEIFSRFTQSTFAFETG